MAAPRRFFSIQALALGGVVIPAVCFFAGCKKNSPAEEIPAGGLIYVAPGGKPGSSGTREDPLAGIQEALSRAQAGDTVRVRPGVYFERVAFRSGGVYQKPVTLEGEPGAILDGSYPMSLKWEPAPDIAPGVFRTRVDQPVGQVVADGKSVTMLREDFVQPGQGRGGADWEWPNLFRDGAGPTGWNGVRAMALYFAKSKQLIIRFLGDRDPREMKISVAPAQSEPIIDISGFSRCVVRGLTLRNAGAGVRVRNSIGSVIERCVIGPVDQGIMLGEGADRTTVRFNEMFWNPYGEGRSKQEGAWEHWLANKKSGYADKHGIVLSRCAGGHEIHDNWIHDHWDGISVTPAGCGLSSNLDIHHNRITTLVDDGIETGGPQKNCRYHDNLLEGCLVGLRIKTPDEGPFYIYRNLFFDNREDIRNFGEKDRTGGAFNPATGVWESAVVADGASVPQPAAGYIYHNTVTANPAYSSNKVRGTGVPNYHYFNNLFWSERWFQNVPKDDPSIDPNWKGDYNVYVRRGNNSEWDQSQAFAQRLGLDQHSVWTSGEPGFVGFETGDVRLTETSPARGKGADLRRLFGFELPGCSQGTGSEAAPDVGAVAFGQPLPRIPRDPAGVEVMAAGTWPGPEADGIPSPKP